MRTMKVMLWVVAFSLMALHFRQVLADNYVEPVTASAWTGTVSEMRYGPYYSGNIVWIRLDGSNTGCHAPLDGGASEPADFVSMPLDRISSSSQKIYLSQLLTAKSSGRTVRIQYNSNTAASCEILFLELK